MKRIIFLSLALFALCAAAAAAEGGVFSYRFADAEEAAALLVANDDYYDGLSQNDIAYRLQKLGGTREELLAFAAAQTLDYTAEEKAAVDDAMSFIEQVCAERGYALPPTDGIVFAKTTMLEECGAGAYTHGTQIYLGQDILQYATMDDDGARTFFRKVVAHELFHCLTRNHPEFRAAMYAILGFTVADADYPLPRSVRDAMISNPDVERHNACAAFEIDGAMRNCVVVFLAGKPFSQPGDSFFDDMVTGLVPVDDLSALYTSEDAANFWDVFGRNTDYVIDPEETLADNFSFAIVDGPDAEYPTPEIIHAIDALLTGAAYTAEAA